MGVARPRFLHALATDGFLNGTGDFGAIQILQGYSFGRLIFPAMFLHASSPEAFVRVSLLRHSLCGGTMPGVWAAVIHVWTASSRDI